jgi:hypothetical protein
MLSLAVCSSASISFSKVDKTLRFEARLINQLKICEGSFIRSLDFLLLFYQEKSKKRKGVNRSVVQDYDKKTNLRLRRANSNKLALRRGGSTLAPCRG